MRLDVAFGDDAVGALDAAWDDLVRVQNRPNPTLLGAWLEPLIVDDSDGLMALRVTDSEHGLLAATVVGIYRPLGRLGPRLARWPGDPKLWFDPDILVSPGHEPAGAMLLDRLLREVDALHAPCLEGSALDVTLGRRAKRTVHRSISADGWTTPLPVPRDAYTRARIARDTRAAARKGAEVTTKVVTAPAEVAEALERLFQLHHEYWSTRPDAIARFSTNAHWRALHRRAVHGLAATGEAFIAEIRENDRVIASGLALRAGDGLVYHTLATKRHTKLREPGHACTLAIMDCAASLGVRHVNLGAGAGEPGSLKHRIGAYHVVVYRTLSSRSRTRVVLYRAFFAGRGRVRASARRVGRLLPKA